MKLHGSVVRSGLADRIDLADSPAHRVFGLGGIGDALEQGMPHSKRKKCQIKATEASGNTMDLEGSIEFM